jgi:hypothetical protein
MTIGMVLVASTWPMGARLGCSISPPLISPMPHHQLSPRAEEEVPLGFPCDGTFNRGMRW